MLLEQSQKKHSTTGLSIGQQPMPSNEHIEQWILSVVLREPEYYAMHSQRLSKDLFYESKYRDVFSVLQASYDKYGKITLPIMINVVSELGLGKDIMAEIVRLRNNHDAHPDLLSDGIQDLYYLSQCRKVSEPLYLALHGATSGDYDKVEAGLNNASTLINGGAIEEVSTEWVEDFEQWLSQPKTSGLSGVPTGIPSLNFELGGWQNTDMIVIAARPGIGKTIVASNHAYHAALAGVPTAYVSTEVDRKKIIARITSPLVTIPYGQISKRDLSESQLKKVIEKAKEVSKLPLYIYDYTNSTDIADVTRKMTHWHKKFGIKLIVIDYLQMLQDKTIKSGDETALVSSLSRKVKDLQSKLNIPIIAASQLSRNIESRPDKRPQQSDLRQSGQIEQDASVIIGLYRDDYYEELKARSMGQPYTFKNEIEYSCIKNRDGGLFTHTLGIKCMFNHIYQL